MCSKIVVAILSFIIVADAVDPVVNLTSRWKPDFGYEINCTWSFENKNDTLQSVRLSDHERQFLVYRPEIHGQKHRQLFQLPEKTFQVDCGASGFEGSCVMTLEPYQPINENLNYACEVSGERPWFRIEKKSIDIPALVPPSAASIDVAQRDSTGSRVVLNCTSSGLPAPTLLWSIGETRVPGVFSGKSWNMTSKLWHSWSLLSFPFNNAPASCAPENAKSGLTAKGLKAVYSSAIQSKVSKLMIFFLAVFGYGDMFSALKLN